MTRVIVTWHDGLSPEPIIGLSRTGALAERRSVATATEPTIATSPRRAATTAYRGEPPQTW